MNKNKELFEVVETFNVEGFGIVERVVGKVEDIAYYIGDRFKSSCSRCCFSNGSLYIYGNRSESLFGCMACRKITNNKDNPILEDHTTWFYRRKTAECVTKIIL